MASTPTLVGMFYLRDGGEYFVTGEILSEVKDGVYMVSTDSFGPTEVTRPLELMAVEDMLGYSPDGMPIISLFKSRADLDEWVEWLNSPEKPNVINLVKPNKD